MAAPSALALALGAPDRSPRTARMAEVMARFEASHGACTDAQLAAAGFSPGEIAAYFDDAVAILEGRPRGAEVTPATAAARAEAGAMVEQARLIRSRERRWAAPVVVEMRGVSA